MDNAQLMTELEREYNIELKKIQDKIKLLMQEAIEETVYGYSDYLKTWYDRTNDFKNSVDVKIDKDGSMLVYINTDKLNYNSYVNFIDTGTDVSTIVPWLLEEGHHSGDKSDLYHNYNGRGYLENAYEKIKREFPELELEIINEKPDWI